MVTMFLEELCQKKEDCPLYSDSHSAIHPVKNYAFHSRTKHIHLRYHFIQYILEDGKLQLEKIHTSDNPIDMFTKVVPKKKLISCLDSIGLLD